MMNHTFDVAIVGAGPAGLSAALVLGRSRRRVVVCDHGRPRNYAAKAVNGYLTQDGAPPAELRQRGRRECAAYGVRFIDSAVEAASRTSAESQSTFELTVENGDIVRARKVLLATGVKDELPEIPNFDSFYGVSIHHCPYCDGWEHRDQQLVALGKPSSASDLAVTLLNWSKSVTVCTDGHPLGDEEVARLDQLGIRYRDEPLARFDGHDGILEEIRFASGKPLTCDAVFFSSSQGQRSPLAEMLGCTFEEGDLVETTHRQATCSDGVFIAGDADGEVQFAIVAAAEGAIAATAINRELQRENEEVVRWLAAH